MNLPNPDGRQAEAGDLDTAESTVTCRRDPNEVEALLRERGLGETTCPDDGLRPGEHGWPQSEVALGSESGAAIVSADSLAAWERERSLLRDALVRIADSHYSAGIAREALDAEVRP